MTLKSAFEDLTGTTLKAVSGLLNKLLYVSGLRKGDAYSHWGLSRVHGESQAQQALSDLHRSLLSQVLRTPIRRLMGDLETSSRQQGMEPEPFLEMLESQRGDLLPPQAGAGSDRHLSSALKALSGLLKARRGSNRPTS